MSKTIGVSAAMPRWLPLVGGILSSTTCGLSLYTWSVFIKPLNAEFGWTRAEISLAFSICLLVFGVTTFFAGKMSDKYGPRVIVAVGSIILSAGFILSGYISTKWGLYLTYGVIAGLGGGMVYLPPIATTPKWWPDRRAFATGFAVVGLGLGSFIMGPLATYMIDAPGIGWRYVFIYVGIAMGIIGFISAWCIDNPPAGWKPLGWSPPDPSTSGQASLHRDYTFSETIRTPQFWLLYAACFCGAFAGVMVIGHIASHGLESGLKSMQTGFAVGVLGIFNAATRLLMGVVADRVGARKSFLMIFIGQVIALILLYPAGSSALFLTVIAAWIGWNHGAIFTIFPAACLHYYGPTSQGANYGLLFTAFGLAGFFGPFIGGMLKDTTGTYAVPFIVGASVVMISVAISFIVRPPARRTG